MLRRNTLAENPVLLISIMFCNIMKSSRGKLRSVRTDCLGHWTTLFYKACNYRPHTVAQFISCHVISRRSLLHFLQE